MFQIIKENSNSTFVTFIFQMTVDKFHAEHHGPNIRLGDCKTNAVRLRYRQNFRETGRNEGLSLILWLFFTFYKSGGILFSEEQIGNRIFAVQVNRVMSSWTGSIEIGVVFGDLEEVSRAPSASLAKNSVVLSGKDHVYTNEQKCFEILDLILLIL